MRIMGTETVAVYGARCGPIVHVNVQFDVDEIEAILNRTGEVGEITGPMFSLERRLFDLFKGTFPEVVEDLKRRG